MLPLLDEMLEKAAEDLVGFLIKGGSLNRRGRAERHEDFVLPLQADVLAGLAVIALLGDELARIRVGLAGSGADALLK